MKTTTKPKHDIRYIRQCFDRLDGILIHGFTDERKAFFELCESEEKEQRGEQRGWGSDFARYHTSDTIGIKDAARLFVVHDLAKFLQGGRMPELKDYLHAKRSHFHGAAIALEFGDKIREAWKGLNIADLAEINYSDLVKVKKDLPVSSL